MNLPKEKTQEELDIILKNLIIIVDDLDQKSINYFIDSGTLLGMYRDKNFIKWDWDVELSITEKEFEKNKEKILDIINKNKFKILKIDKVNKKIDFTKDLNSNINKFSFKVWKLNEKKSIFYRNNFEIPTKFFEKIDFVECFGRKFNSPNKIEEYLTYMYGNWKVPLRTTDKSKYLSKNYFKRSFYKKIKDFVFNKFNN